MSYIPKNIRDMVGQNELYAQRQAEVTLHKKTSVATHWFERDRQRLTSTAAGTTTGGPSVTMHITPELRDAGVKSGLQTVKAARQAKLREKLEREAQAYEAELNAMGLALVKPRD